MLRDFFAKIERGEPVMPPGVPKNYPDAKKLVTEDCIRQQLLSRGRTEVNQDE